MTDFANEFIKLHHCEQPLQLVNIWDPASLCLAQAAGAAAVGTSSAALAWSLGYRDAEQLPIAELLAAVQRLLRVSQLPLTIDLEQGYSDQPQQVASLVQQLADMGVAGVNLEDGADEPALLVNKIAACRELLAGQVLFINARTDVFLRGLAATESAALAMCQQRAECYKAAGADGLFVPGVSCLKLISGLSQSIGLPLNIMGWPVQAKPADLVAAGVQRISAGPALFIASANALQRAIGGFLQQPAAAEPLNYTSLDQLF